MFKDLREWLEQADALGEIRRVNGAHWDQEIGAVTDMINRKRNGPAVLFDEIVDYPKGYRLLVNSAASSKRLSLTLGFSTKLAGRDLAWEWQKLNSKVKPLATRTVEDGPVTENVSTGEDIDLTRFPSPRCICWTAGVTSARLVW